ncbi:MAG: class I SAM-dependent methyltransferase [Gammaproteobacteria bacterium]|nr:class I SAM-dependent methyltransferase [Gammaproteobacteria bacterium]
MKSLSDKKIIESWHKNAHAWINAIRNNEIQSRVEITNQAIIDTILDLKPKSVLDIGCGEGWLVRELCQKGIDTLGIDVVAELIDYAQQTGKGRFDLISYEQLATNTLNEKFDLVVCNFSLLGKESVEDIFNIIPTLLNPGGHFVIQTLHPKTACGHLEYKDGWRDGSWDGFNKQFSDPAPWYFRTLASWERLYDTNSLNLLNNLEYFCQNNKLVSIVFVAQLSNKEFI